MSYLIQPLSKLHLETDIGLDIGQKGNKKYLTLFSIIGVLILLLACINYVNLATARSILRAKEVGLRKAIGAQRNQIMAQFIGESALTTLLALFVGLLISYLVLPAFSFWLERSLEINFLENTFLIPGLIILMLLIGLVTGSYPALFVSSLRPVQALKGKTDRKIAVLSIQRWLMVGQYTATVVLIIGSLVVYQQFQFIQNKDLGFQKDQVIAISVRDFSLGDKISTIKNELRTNPQIIAVTDAIELPTNVTSSTIVRHLHENKEEGFHINRARVGVDYIEVFGINLIAGRNFLEDSKSDRENARILNETAVRELGWTPEEAVGKRFIDWEEREIIGVVKDFHSHSLHREIEPLMLQMKSNYTPFFAVKIQSENIPESVSFIQKTLKEYSPYPFEYEFLDDRYEQLYRAEQKFGIFFGILTALGIFIATLGLIGMTALMVNQRIREIGIRKVLGASIKNILATLASGYLKLIFLSFLIAIPTAWWAMNNWLQGFAYRIDLQWWVFAVAGAVTISLAVITIGGQSIKTAVANPVDSLRSE
ncbi:MAG: FtsX-like permease family protein, partial [Bacteroidota bacterium]